METLTGKAAKAHRLFFSGGRSQSEIARILGVTRARVGQYLQKSEARTLLGEPLTKRETEVAKLIINGNTNRQIADLLSISIKTVEKHRDRAYKKYGAHGTASFVMAYIRAA